MRRGRRLARSFYRRDALDVAPDLLNKVMRVGERSGRIVEVEAYRGPDDPGSHGFRGPTPRTEVMYGPAGHLYVYFTYGMHWCANVVCAPAGTCSAVLLRALAPLTGLDQMFELRPAARRATDLCSGPAKLCQAMGIDGALDGSDLAAPRPVVDLCDDGTPPPGDPIRTSRVGLSRGADLPWRWFVADDPNVSR